jgi:hypothetical protein
MRRSRRWKLGSERSGSRIWVAIGVCFPPPWAKNNASAVALLLFVEDGDVVDLLALCVCTGRCIG